MASRSNTDMIQTTDMTLATYLIVEGCDAMLVKDESERMPGGDPKAAWQFRRSDTILGLIDEYEASEALVEPQAFHKTLSAIRRSAMAKVREESS